MEQNLPPGFRFHPTDEELITYYLARKVKDFNFVTRAITNVDFNKCEPWDLPGKASMGKKEWYFFSLKDRKYPTGLRTNRATDAGYWKTTGKDKEIFHSGVLVGMKKTLVFYKGRAPKGVKTNWVMHEYRIQNKYPYKKDEWVVCRVFLKSSTNKRPSSPQNFHDSVHYSNSCATHAATHALVSELGELDVTNMGSMLSSSTGFNTSSISSNSMDTNMSWAISGEATIMNPPFSWPSNYSINSNPLANSNLMKALQFGHYQVPDPGSTDINPLLMQASGILGSSMIGPSNSNTSSSKVINPVEPQSFHLDPIWRAVNGNFVENNSI